MTLKNLAKAPFPWFGGKTHAAPHVWEALGDVEHFVDPFMGSLAVLLLRPHECNRTYRSETVNDLDGLLVNAWRSIQLSPEATAAAASWPVSEADLTARHLALVRWREERDLERLMADPAFHDPVVGGWWLWGVSCWIGGGWCSGTGPWVVGPDGRITKRPRCGVGVSARRPHLGNNGQGVNRPQTREPGVSADEEPEYHPMTMPELRRWFLFLSARLRHVRIINGGWRRALTDGAAKILSVRMNEGVAGIFLDPPYAHDRRDPGLYSHDSSSLSQEVGAWAAEHGSDKKLRIVIAGFGDEHDHLLRLGWRKIEWFKGGFLRGGMALVGGTTRQTEERLWLSPHCLGAPVDDRQQELIP